MPAIIRPDLTLTVSSHVNATNTPIVSTILTNINSVDASRVPAQHLDLPQRNEYHQLTYNSIGANFQWEVHEALLSIKPRGLR